MRHLKLIFLLSLALLVSSGDADAGLIRQVCFTTSNSKLCVATLQSDRRSSSADTTGLILILIDAAKSKFTDSLAAVNQMRKKSPAQALAKALKECSTQFRFVLTSDIPEAKSAVPSNPKFGEDAMNSAANSSADCEEAVARSGGEDFDGAGGGAAGSKSALINQAKLLYEISHITATMIRILE